jgi:hypothetical protein
MHDDIDITGQQPRSHFDHEDAGAADGRERTEIDITLGSDPDQFTRNAGDAGQPVGNRSGLRESQRTAPGADAEHARQRAPRIPDAARVAASTSSSCQSAAES